MNPYLETNNLKEFNEKTFADEGEFQDRNIPCIDCGQDFIWSIGEQVFFRDKGLTNPPKRCKGCKPKMSDLPRLPPHRMPESNKESRSPFTAPNAILTRPFPFTLRKVVRFYAVVVIWKNTRT
jgi:Probable zinc-ribbon domain